MSAFLTLTSICVFLVAIVCLIQPQVLRLTHRGQSVLIWLLSIFLLGLADLTSEDTPATVPEITLPEILTDSDVALWRIRALSLSNEYAGLNQDRQQLFVKSKEFFDALKVLDPDRMKIAAQGIIAYYEEYYERHTSLLNDVQDLTQEARELQLVDETQRLELVIEEHEDILLNVENGLSDLRQTYQEIEW